VRHRVPSHFNWILRWVCVPHIAKAQPFKNKDRKLPQKLCLQGTAVCSGSMLRFCGEQHEHLGFNNKATFTQWVRKYQNCKKGSEAY